jgi:hypothetical protein
VIGDLSGKSNATSAERRTLAIIGGLFGGSVAAYLGAKSGAPTKSLETIQINGISAGQLLAILKRLNSEARIRDPELT